MNLISETNQGTNPYKNSLKQPRVLVVDDEPLICWSLRSAMMNKGFEVITAASFKDGIREIYSRSFDVLIADLKLDESDGFNVIISARDKNPSIKTILITAFGDENCRHKANELYVDLFVEKPLVLSEMVNSVSFLIDKKTTTNPN
ncbi:MAG: response regulator [Ignavibacteria bacterium]|nr:response regulator [Ignavibacteria bacterium]